MNDAAIVIVTYNSAGEIAACLESIFAQRKHVSQQVIVVDNDSRDGTAEIVRRDFPQVDLLLPGKNLGFAKGVNLGAAHAKAEYILLLNPDTAVLDGAVDTLVDFARKNPQYGLYGGRTFSPEGRLEPSSCWGAPTLWSTALFAFGISKLAPRNRFLDPESLGTWQRDTVREVGVITGCLLLVHSDAWKKLGGMDERFFMYGEDADFSMRAWKAGYRPVICPDARIMHEIGKSSETPAHKLVLLYRGKAALIRTHWTGLAQSLGLTLLAAGTGLRAALSGGRWRTLWGQRGDWLQGYPETRR